MKCMGVNLTKCIQDLYVENRTAPMNKVKELNTRATRVHEQEGSVLPRWLCFLT